MQDVLACPTFQSHAVSCSLKYVKLCICLYECVHIGVCLCVYVHIDVCVFPLSCIYISLHKAYLSACLSYHQALPSLFMFSLLLLLSTIIPSSFLIFCLLSSYFPPFCLLPLLPSILCLALSIACHPSPWHLHLHLFLSPFLATPPCHLCT